MDPNGHSPLWCGEPFIGCVDTAKNAMLSAKLAYSKAGPILLSLNPINSRFNCFNSAWSKPNSAIDLLADYFCERGPDWVEYNGMDSLSKELAQSVLINEVRRKFYQNGSFLEPAEYKFNIPQFGLALLDAIDLKSGTASLPIMHVMGSFDYSVQKTSLGRIEFTINNRTDLSSGTHIPLRYPPENERDNPYSLEQYIQENPEMENEGVFEILLNHPEILSILKIRDRSATGFMMGGGTMRQTFTWSEKDLGCEIQKLPWPVYLPFLDIQR